MTSPRRTRPAPLPVGGGLRPAPLGKGSVSHRFPLLRNAPAPRRGGPMCPPGHASSRDPFTGRHTGRPLRSRSKYPSTPEERAGTEPRPYRSIAVPSSGPMWASAPTKGRESGSPRPPRGRNLPSPVTPGWFLPKEGPQPFLWSFQGGVRGKIEIPPEFFFELHPIC